VKRMFFILCMIFVWSCGGNQATKVETAGPTVQQVVTYHGPKARIAVASFKCKAAWCQAQKLIHQQQKRGRWSGLFGKLIVRKTDEIAETAKGIGTGMSDMLTTALFRSGRFIVLERGEGLKSLKEEIDLSQTQYVNQSQAIKPGLLEGADILVIGAITEFEPAEGNVKGMAIPGFVPYVGGLSFQKKTAHVAADIRLVDVRTGRIISAIKTEGKTSDWGVSGIGLAFTRNLPLAAGLSYFKNTPMEKAIRVMVDQTVNEIAKQIPESYYRYEDNTNQEPDVQTANQQQPENTRLQKSSVKNQKEIKR